MKKDVRFSPIINNASVAGEELSFQTLFSVWYLWCCLEAKGSPSQARQRADLRQSTVWYLRNCHETSRLCLRPLKEFQEQLRRRHTDPRSSPRGALLPRGARDSWLDHFSSAARGDLPPQTVGALNIDFLLACMEDVWESGTQQLFFFFCDTAFLLVLQRPQSNRAPCKSCVYDVFPVWWPTSAFQGLNERIYQSCWESKRSKMPVLTGNVFQSHKGAFLCVLF